MSSAALTRVALRTKMIAANITPREKNSRAGCDKINFVLMPMNDLPVQIYHERCGGRQMLAEAEIEQIFVRAQFDQYPVEKIGIARGDCLRNQRKARLRAVNEATKIG